MAYYYQKSTEEVIKDLRSSDRGITSADARERLLAYGYNKLDEFKQRTVFMMFLDQFRDFMIMVLIAAAVVSGLIGEIVDTLAIAVIIVLKMP